MITDQSKKLRKKALLVGICYEENEDTETLQGGHEGVFELKKVLVGKS